MSLSPLRAFTLSLAVGSTLALVGGCGSPKQSCSSTSCSGCCDTAGNCLPGNENLNCGAVGAFCQSCQVGLRCMNGICTVGSMGGGTGGGTGGGAGGGAGGGTGGGTGGSGGGVGGGGGIGGGIGGGAGGGTGGAGGGGTPTFTSQLWYYGRVSSTARAEVGRVLFPSQTRVPVSIPGNDLRSWSGSQDGRKLAVATDATVAGRFDLCTLNFDGTGFRTLVPAPAGSNITFVRFSPDATKLIYELTSAAGLRTLWYVPAGGGTSVDITPVPPVDTARTIVSTTFSRDSRYLAVTGDFTTDRATEAWVVDLGAAPPTKTNVLPPSTIGPVGATGFWGATSPVQWSSSARLLFKGRVGGNALFRLFQVGVDGSGFGVVPGTPDASTAQLGSFGVTRDGNTLAFSADTMVPTAYEVFATPLNVPGSVTRVTSGALAANQRPDFNRPLRFSVQGTRLAFPANFFAGGTIFEPYALSLASAGEVRLAALTATPGVDTGLDVTDLQYSPDGTQLAFVGDFRTDGLDELGLAGSLTSLATPAPLVTPVAGGRVEDLLWTP